MKKPKVYRSEADVKKEIKRLLTEHGWFWWMPPANAYGKSGISDIHAVRSSMFMVVEAKFDGNKPTALQIGFLNSVRTERHFAFVVDEKTVTFFAQFLVMLDQAVEAQSKNLEVPIEVGSAMINAIKVMTDPIPLT